MLSATIQSKPRQGAIGSINRVWANASITALCDHIERTHHAYLKFELPQLSTALLLVSSKLAFRYPQLIEISRLFDQLKAGLLKHVNEEEHVWFPLCRQLDAGVLNSEGRRIFDRLEAEFREHDLAQERMQQIRKLTDHYAVPSAGSGMLAACYHRLHRLEVDLANHIHKENAILYRIAARAQRTADLRQPSCC